MKRSHGVGMLAQMLFVGAGAEAAVRALSPREAVPAPEAIDVRQHFSSEEIARGRRFARPQMAIGMTQAMLDAVALALVVRRSVRRAATRARIPQNSQHDAGTVTEAVASIAMGSLLSAGLALPGLPLSVLARHRALKVGLATQTWPAWGRDLLKSSAIQSAMAGVGAAAMTSVARRWPHDWWLPAAGGFVMFGGAFAALAPVVLDPIFNDFTPLPEGQTRSDVLALAEQAGVTIGEVYSVDASRRTTAANAYITGFGPTKRVVLFDTLLDRYSRDEVKVVVAHELAHVRHRDVVRSVAFAAMTSPGAALAIQRLSWVLSPERGTVGALPALAMAAGAVSVPLGLSANRLSRAVERRADAFSLYLTDAPEAFVSFERAIALQNIADVEPWRPFMALLSTHPPTHERIGAAVAYQRRQAQPA